jgi:hypothetical protein
MTGFDPSATSAALSSRSAAVVRDVLSIRPSTGPDAQGFPRFRTFQICPKDLPGVPGAG